MSAGEERAARMLKQTQPFPSSHPPEKVFKNPPRQQSRHETETQKEWEGRSERERGREMRSVATE